MRVSSLDELVERAQKLPTSHMSVVAAHDLEVLRSVDEAQRRGIATSTLFGDAARIKELARAEGLALAGIDVVDQPDEELAAAQAVSLIRQGQANIAVKGQIKTSQFLRAALNRERGIRDKKLISHITLLEVPGFDRLIYLSDAGVVLYPTTMQKRVIIQNAVDVARKLGIDEPKVAILAANERVHPARPTGVEALLLARMAREGWVTGALVDGPMPLDVALYPRVARLKGVDGPVAGEAEVLIVPNVEAGNIAAKAIQYIGGGALAGLVVGARVPIVINSRADDAVTRLRSVAMAALVAS